MTADEWRGAGLAAGIMRALIQDARARGLTRMEGYVLAENRSMLALARRLGFEVGASEEGPSVKLVRLDLGSTTQKLNPGARDRAGIGPKANARARAPGEYCPESIPHDPRRGLLRPLSGPSLVQYTRNQELRSFLFLTVVMAPVLTGMIVAGYGFLVWMYQVISGPPTGG